MATENFGKYLNGGVALAIGLVISSVILGYSYQSKKVGIENVEVTGSAKKRIKSDLVTWSAGLAYQDPQVSAAYSRLSEDIPKVKQYLIKQGVDEKEITISAISTTTLYRSDIRGNRTSEISGYTLRQRVRIRSKKVDLVAKIARESTELINEGILVESDSPQYYFTGLSKLKVEMLGEAARNARIRAEKIASNTGSSIGTIRSARMGVMQITAADSTEVSDYGINDTSTIDKDVTAVVKVKFAVN